MEAWRKKDGKQMVEPLNPEKYVPSKLKIKTPEALCPLCGNPAEFIRYETMKIQNTDTISVIRFFCQSECIIDFWIENK